jgi:hypothetical protein
MPGRGSHAPTTTGFNSGRAAPTIAQDRQPPQTAKRRPRTISARGQVCPSEGKVHRKMGTCSVSPLRGRPLAKTRCFQGPGTAPRRAKYQQKRAPTCSRAKVTFARPNLTGHGDEVASAWRGSGAIRASGMKLASFSLPSTAGSPRVSTRSI